MKRKILVTFIILIVCKATSAQNAAVDTNLVRVVLNASWMPDGKALLITGAQFDRSRRQPPQFNIYKLELASKKAELLIADANDPVVSPEGNSIAFSKPIPKKPSFDIYLYDLSTKKQIPLLTDTIIEVAPSWSPDGKKIVYCVRKDLQPPKYVMELFVLDIKTMKSTQITNNGFKSFNPVWAPKGDKIVYYLEKDDRRDQIYLTDEKGSFQRNLTADTSTHNYYPSWLNDKIIYTTGSQNSRLSIIDQDGGNKKALLSFKVSRAFYNPKVDQILCINSTMNETQIIIYDRKTSKEESVLTNEQIKQLFELK